MSTRVFAPSTDAPSLFGVATPDSVRAAMEEVVGADVVVRCSFDHGYLGLPSQVKLALRCPRVPSFARRWRAAILREAWKWVEAEVPIGVNCYIWWTDCDPLMHVSRTRMGGWWCEETPSWEHEDET